MSSRFANLVFKLPIISSQLNWPQRENLKFPSDNYNWPNPKDNNINFDGDMKKRVEISKKRKRHLAEFKSDSSSSEFCRLAHSFPDE
jgi:hypothetical protein